MFLPSGGFEVLPVPGLWKGKKMSSDDAAGYLKATINFACTGEQCFMHCSPVHVPVPDDKDLSGSQCFR